METHDSELDAVTALDDRQLLALRGRLEQELAKRESLQETAVRFGHACRLFTVSKGVRRLHEHQLAALRTAFETWVEEARDQRTRRSRERVLIVFLVLRFTGARLGEVLALDEFTDLDSEQGEVCIGGRGSADMRAVPLPQDVMDRVREWIDRNGSTVAGSSSERLFALDQGFLRRKFQEQEQRSGIARDMLNPRILRNSRAVELLQGGMPMRAVQSLLGHSKTDFTASYVTLADDDLKHIIQHYCSKEFGMETSARNTFNGTVTKVASNAVVAEVILKTDSGYEISAVITNQSLEKLGFKEGRRATALVKATWVILEKASVPTTSSARNTFPGVVTKVVCDDVVADVQGKLMDGTPVCALITMESYRKLDIGEGDSFFFMFKAMNVIVS